MATPARYAWRERDHLARCRARAAAADDAVPAVGCAHDRDRQRGGTPLAAPHDPGRPPPTSSRHDPPWLVSYALWANVLQYLDHGVAVVELRRRARTDSAPPRGPASFGVRLLCALPTARRCRTLRRTTSSSTSGQRGVGPARPGRRSPPSWTLVGATVTARPPSTLWPRHCARCSHASRSSPGVPPGRAPDAGREVRNAAAREARRRRPAS